MNGKTFVIALVVFLAAYMVVEFLGVKAAGASRGVIFPLIPSQHLR